MEVKAPADFILVQNKTKPDAQKRENSRFIKNLKRVGLIIEVSEGIKYTDYLFIKIRASDDVLTKLAKLHGVYPTFQHDKTVPPYNNRFMFFKTKISLKPKYGDPEFDRTSNTVKGAKTVTYTSAERICIINCVLQRTKFGPLPEEHGLAMLLMNKNFDDAYPLHDGPSEWTDTGPLNDRQILAKYWGNWRKFYKLQPLHVIYKYFGSEIAFFYAFVEYYSKMLLIPTVFGIIASCLGQADLYFWANDLTRVQEICESTLKMCPSCMQDSCYYVDISSNCQMAQASYLIDNGYNVLLALIVAIWGTFNLAYWERRERTLIYHWNLESSSPQVDELPNFRDRLKDYHKTNPFTKTEHFYVPFLLKCRIFFLTYLQVFLFILLVLAVAALILISLHFIEHIPHKYEIQFALDYMWLLNKIYSAFLTIVLIHTMEPAIMAVTTKLTDKEIHRTQSDYMNAFIFKMYILSFFLCYTLLFYNAFFQDFTYTNPGDYGIYNYLFGIGSALCPPAIGCSMDVSATITFSIWKTYILILFYKSYIYYVTVRLIKRIRNLFTLQPPVEEVKNVPQWEIEYALIPSSDLFFVQSFTTMIIQYGFITFFSATQPLLPLMALVNNVVELRMTAMKLIRKTRRNVPKRVLGLGAWKVILVIVTRLCFLISALVISFTSTFVSRSIYYFEHHTDSGFLNDCLSVFAVNDYEKDVRRRLRRKYPDIDYCYYPGHRSSFNETHPYTRNDRFHKFLTIKLIVVVIYIHVVYFLSGIIAYMIPKVPTYIRRHIAYDNRIQGGKNFEGLAIK